MKKIVSAVAVGALVLAAASAEFTVKGNARTVWLGYDKASLKGDGSETTDVLKPVKAADDFSFDAKTDAAEVHLTLTMDALGGKTKDVTVAKYWGVMHFGNLNLTAGNFESIYTKRGNTTLVEGGLTDDGANLQTIKHTSYKNLGTTTGFLKDFNNVSAVGGTRGNAFVADYTFSDVAEGKLLVKGAAVAAVKDEALNGEYRTDSYAGDGDDKVNVHPGYGLSVALQRSDFVVEGIVRTTSYYNVGAGLYLTLTKEIIPMSNMILGFTWGSTSKTKAGATDTNGYNAYAFDFRYTVNPTDQLQLVLNGKYESSTAKTDGAKAENSLYVVGQVGYVVSDLINVAIDAGVYYKDLDDNDKADNGENVLIIRPAVELKASKSAKLTTALEYSMKLNTGDMADDTAKSELCVPVIFRVKL